MTNQDLFRSFFSVSNKESDKTKDSVFMNLFFVVGAVLAALSSTLLTPTPMTKRFVPTELLEEALMTVFSDSMGECERDSARAPSLLVL